MSKAVVWLKCAEFLKKDIPQLKKIAGKQWKKEDELKGLKSELAALDRKIQLELAKNIFTLGYVIPVIRAHSGLGPIRHCSCRA